jgi:drug/metabolite transporter (DMT)-like permease
VARPAEIRLLAAVLCSLWGTQFVVQRIALEEASAPWVAAGRAGVAALVLLPLIGRLRGLGRRGWLTVIILGVTNQAAFVGLQVAGLSTVGAGPAAAIVYLQPVLVVLAAGPVLGERLTARKLVAAVLGFTGVAIVGLHQASEASVAGVLFLLGAAVSWTVGTLVTSAAAEPIVPLVVGQHLLGAPALLAAAAIAEPFPHVSAKLAACVLYAGAAGSALAWMIWSSLMRRGDTAVVSTWLFAVPVLAAVLGVLWLDEPLSIELLVGIALVALAVRLAAAAAGDRATARPPGTAA